MQHPETGPASECLALIYNFVYTDKLNNNYTLLLVMSDSDHILFGTKFHYLQAC